MKKQYGNPFGGGDPFPLSPLSKARACLIQTVPKLVNLLPAWDFFQSNSSDQKNKNKRELLFASDGEERKVLTK